MARILVIGGGLIGCGWAAAFAGAGHDVVVSDPDPKVSLRLDELWRAAQPVMASLETLRDDVVAPKHVLSFEGLTDIEMVQEALPEDLDLKHRVLAALEQQIADHVPIVSSSSGFTPQMIAQSLARPERAFIAHPCNPPYLMPTVELVGHSSTSKQILDRAEAFFSDMGKTVLRIARPVRGHLLNRLQFALWREAVHLVETGVASMADVERAVTEGLAPRWCLMGPGGVFHLSGGTEGMAGYLCALGEATTEIWADLGTPNLATAGAALTLGIQDTDPRPVLTLAGARDAALPSLMQALKPIKADYYSKGERENE